MPRKSVSSSDTKQVRELAKKLLADPEILEPFTADMAHRTAQRIIRDRHSAKS